MFTLRALPPGRGGRNALLAVYQDGLRRHWRLSDRMMGLALWALGSGGWTPTERRSLPEDIRADALSMRQRKGIYRLLNPAAFPLRSNILKNKALFAAHVARRNLPAPLTYDPARHALEPWLATRAAVIAKPSYSSKGRGVAVHACADPAALARLLRPLLDAGGVVQERAETHPDFADISPGALPTLRVVTCLDEGGAPEPCATVLKLGSGGPRPVDNFNAGGLAVRIDGEGRAVAAFRRNGPSIERVDRHPVGGVPVAGRRVPDLADALALAARAHATLPPGYTVVGWDVGLSDRGPVLIEGNWNPGTDIIQLVNGVGLAATRLGALCRHHLEHLPPERWRAARPVERDSF